MLSSKGRINKSAAPVDKEKLHEELQDLGTQREKVIEERKQCHLEHKGSNDHVRKKVCCILHSKSANTTTTVCFLSYFQQVTWRLREKIRVVNRYKTAVSDLFYYCYFSELICDLPSN